MQIFKKREGDTTRLPLWSFVLLGLAALSLLLYFAAVISEGFANFFNRTVAAFVRSLLAHLTSWLPVSLAELLLYCVPLIIVILCLFAYRNHCGSWREVFVYLGSILSVCSMLFTLFVFTLGTGYHTTTLDKRLSIPPVEVSEESLVQTAQTLIAEINALAGQNTYADDGFSVMPYDLDTMNDKLLEAYLPLCEEYDFIQRLNSNIKPVIASKPMSYTHITGVYSYFTGEANLNVHFPDYTLPFTAAHELAHQRGIARENEANFIAFLVCLNSTDPYIRYTGYLNMFEYVSNAVYSTDRDAYKALLEQLDGRVLNELRAYSDFFDTFRDSLASDISDTVNDTYLKLHGNKAGTASYGLVVELAVAYYQNGEK